MLKCLPDVCMEKTKKELERRNKKENKDDEKAGDPLKTVSAAQSRFAKDIKDMDKRISILTNLFSVTMYLFVVCICIV